MVGLALLESFSRAVTGAKGGMSLNLDVAGTWKHPRLEGNLLVRDGSFLFAPMGTAAISGIDADVRFAGGPLGLRQEARRADPFTVTVRMGTDGQVLEENLGVSGAFTTSRTR